AHHADAGDDDVAAHVSRPSTSVTLCPPKPYDEVRATPSGCRRPAVGTRSRSLHAGSGSRSVAVGGSSEPSSASTVATASTAPAAGGTGRDRPEGARSARPGAGWRLRGAARDAGQAIAEDGAQDAHLTLVVLSGAGAVGVDVVDRLGRHRRRVERAPHRGERR